MRSPVNPNPPRRRWKRLLACAGVTAAVGIGVVAGGVPAPSVSAAAVHDVEVDVDLAPNIAGPNVEADVILTVVDSTVVDSDRQAVRSGPSPLSSPRDPNTGQVDAIELPHTGVTSTSLVLMAAVLFLSGASAIVTACRERSED